MTTKITPKNVDRLQHVAVSRLTLYMTAQIHVMLGELQTWLLTQVRQATDTDGNVEMAQLSAVLPTLDTKWHRFAGDYTTCLQRARTQAGEIAFTPLWQRHNAMFPVALDRIQEAFTPTPNDWQQLAAMWLQRRDYALRVAQQRVWSDGLTLSQRIWRLDHGGLSQIRATIAQGMAERTSAVQLAQQLEMSLGADMEMPRWAYARLNKMTASERAIDKTGLLYDPAQRTQGLAYNALRLARNEIQYANHAVTSDIAQHFPGIVGRWVRLSPAHPQSDICDSYAAGGPYDKTANFLPLHPQCVTPGQFVQTRRGQVPIEAVRVGDFVLTHKGRYCLVTAAWGTDHSDQVYEFETDTGRFELTGNHPVLLARGWVNAQDVQLGDRVLYAAGSILTDLPTIVAEDTPALFGKPSISPYILDNRSFVPADAVNLNANFAGNESEVEEVASNLIFTFVDEIGGVHGVNHGEFDTGGIVDSPLPESQQHGHKARVRDLLSSGDFATDIGSLGDVDPVAEQSLVGFAHLGGGSDGARPVVTIPGCGDSFTPTAQLNAVGVQQLFEATISNPVTLKDFGRTEFLHDIDVSQEICDGRASFGFDAQGLEFSGGEVVLGEMGPGPSLQYQAANGASNGHDNLLVLSPDYRWGTGSGNPGVRGVITPSQALLNYSTVRKIERRYYAGKVYNMTVADDNSYTVGGHVVHNCMCRYEEAMMDPKQFAANVRGWLQNENDFLNDYTAWLGLRQVGPLPATLPALAAMALWLDGNVDAMAHILQL